MYVKLEILGQTVALPRDAAERLQARAAAQAGSSSRRRDLALVLDWALSSPRLVVLRRSEARELLKLVGEDPSLADLAASLGVAAPRANAA